MGNGKIKNLSSAHISGVEAEPFAMVYVEVPCVEDVWVRSLQGLMAGSEILKEGRVVSMIRRTVTKA